MASASRLNASSFWMVRSAQSLKTPTIDCRYAAWKPTTIAALAQGFKLFGMSGLGFKNELLTEYSKICAHKITGNGHLVIGFQTRSMKTFPWNTKIRMLPTYLVYELSMLPSQLESTPSP